MGAKIQIVDVHRYALNMSVSVYMI